MNISFDLYNFRALTKRFIVFYNALLNFGTLLYDMLWHHELWTITWHENELRFLLFQVFTKM